MEISMTLNLSKLGTRIGLSFNDADPVYINPQDLVAVCFNGDDSLEIEYIRRNERKYESIALAGLSINGSTYESKQEVLSNLESFF